MDADIDRRRGEQDAHFGPLGRRLALGRLDLHELVNRRRVLPDPLVEEAVNRRRFGDPYGVRAPLDVRGHYGPRSRRRRLLTNSGTRGPEHEQDRHSRKDRFGFHEDETVSQKKGGRRRPPLTPNSEPYA